MASQRHENLDLIMGFTRACNILGQTGIVINTQVAGGGDGENANTEVGSTLFDLRRPYLQRAARPVQTRVTESATNRRVRRARARRPSTARARPRAIHATKSRSTTVENSSDTEENGDVPISNSPNEDPQDPSITDGPQMVEYWWLATGELANLQIFFRPADYNVLWRLITASSRPDFTDNMKKELDVLDSANIEDLMNIAWGLASCLSLGCGLALHSNNMYGSILNDYYQPNPRAGNELLSVGRFLFESSTDFDKNNLISSSGSFTERVFLDESAVPGIFKIAMAELSNVTPYTIGSKTHTGACHIYCTHGPIRDTSLSGIAYGDDPAVWIYKPYAAAIINLMCQRFGFDDLSQIQYREWNRGRATRPGPGAYGTYIFGQTAYVNGLAMIRPGQLPTYSWETDAILAPYISRNEFGDLWNLVRGSDYNINLNVGIILPRIIPIRTARRPLMDACAFYSETSGIESSEVDGDQGN
ncbi:hypothetical protein GJ496_005102 [Pomphorhynchus laevis]|nr:hypothetical protein GJ496_005102 [Pomphorhynchus laevis]